MSAAHQPQQDSSPADRQVVERLVPVWLRETERHDADAARRAREGGSRASCPGGPPRTWPCG
ncbi:hypothetical protein [Streptomyces collinus]|uniref:hypothetical protein n=1 Tax=Streptomyces collinus TaxID=42684 RepID=UPI0034017ED1